MHDLRLSKFAAFMSHLSVVSDMAVRFCGAALLLALAQLMLAAAHFLMGL